jgi:hypothetical protein
MAAAGRARLRGLAEEDLVTLVQRLPGLARMWAKSAHTSADRLRDGKRSAVTAVKTRLIREPEGFQRALALSAVLLVPDIDIESPVDARELAEVLRDDMGPDLGRFLLHVVAEVDEAFAVHVGERLEECLTVFDEPRAAQNEPQQIVAETASDLGISDGIDGSDLSESGDARSEKKDHHEPADDDEPGQLLQEIEELVRHAPEVAAGLHASAELIESGVPSVDLGPAIAWLARAQAVIDDDDSLGARAEWLSEQLQATDQAREAELEAERVRQAALEAERVRQAALEAERLRLTGLRDAVEMLTARGLVDYADNLLIQGGFDGLDALYEALAATENPGTGSPVQDRPSHDASAEPVIDRGSVDDSDEYVDGVDDALESSATRHPVPRSADTATVPVSRATPPEALGAQLASHGEDVDKVTEHQTSPSSAVVDERDDFDPANEPNPREVEATSHAEPTVEMTDDDEAPRGRATPIADASPVLAPVTQRPTPTESAAPDSQPAHAPQASAGSADSREEPAADSPWIEPESAQITYLLISDRDAIAVLLAEHEFSDTPRTRALRLFAEVFNTQIDYLQARLPDLVLDSDDLHALSHDELRLVLVAGARMALELGFSPVGSLEPLRERAGLEDHPAGDLLAAIVPLAQRGFQLPIGSETVNIITLPSEWKDIVARSDQFLEQLPTKSVRYQRASKVLHHLASDSESLGTALRAVHDLGGKYQSGQRLPAAEWTLVEQRARELRTPAQRTRLINAADLAVSSAQQRRQAITGPALQALHSNLAAVGQLFDDSLALRTRTESAEHTRDPRDAGQLMAALGDLAPFPIDTPGDAALSRLVDWLRNSRPTLATRSLDQSLEDALRPIFELPRDIDDHAERQPTREELAIIVDGQRKPFEVVSGYLTIGNQVAAERFLAANNIERDDKMDDVFQRAARNSTRAHNELVVKADRIVSRLRALRDDDECRSLAERIEPARTVTNGRHDLAAQELHGVITDGELHLATVRGHLEERLQALDGSESAPRIQALLNDGDEPLAVEYLALAEAGTPLPNIEPTPGDDFGAFYPTVVQVAQDAGTGTIAAVEAVRAHLQAARHSASRVLGDGLRAWLELARHQQAGPEFPIRLANLVRMLGLVPRPEGWLRHVTRTKRAGYATFEVLASPIDRSYIPGLGTLAHGTYDVTLVWDAASPQRLLQLIEEDRRSRANIICYFGTITAQQRLELRRLTTRPGSEVSPIVVDNAVAGWLTSLPEAGWRMTQRVTLPFTTFNPYTPFAGGEVPDEVFVGREAERRDIVDPIGSMFVYGGRQLGKSALLRRVEREFMAVRSGDASDDRVAVYLDLKAASIGEAVPPDGIWAVLAPRLVRTGVLPEKQRGSWTADAVITAIGNWLDADPTRRLLLLLDEADNFLTVDAHNPTGLGEFPTLQRLKGEMERTERRFKPVFAGLHQVQRFHDLPNTPVAHGGRDILVGPLRPVDARQLVRDPLHALGYEFENDETIWRLLLFTNYQASLIQIICYELVQHLRREALPGDGGRIVITNRHVDDIYAKRDVRDSIAQRFRWTINLDPRYRVIALVTAFRTFGSEPAELFSAEELQAECAYYWSAGFGRRELSEAEFKRYLEEMQGLGVLHRRGERFGLRSPNIRGLLGSQERIEAELLEVADTLEVDHGYNPSVNRRLLDRVDDLEQRSPLPDGDLAKLLHGGHLVVGTRGLGLERVPGVLEIVARERARTLRRVEPRELIRTIRRTKSAVLLTELERSGQVDLAAVFEEAAAADTATVLLAGSTIDLNDLGLDLDSSGLLRLRRWSFDGLKSWPESPFSTPGLRQQLKDVTGGWPTLVEQTMQSITRGSSPEAALQEALQPIRSSDGAAAFLKAIGMPADLAAGWVEWFAQDEGDGQWRVVPVTYDDLSAADLSADPEALVLKLQLLDVVDEAPTGWVLDRVVVEAARHLR